eukprot:scaffold8708_cov157-Skeletonema_marinoi.AAC.5
MDSGAWHPWKLLTESLDCRVECEKRTRPDGCVWHAGVHLLRCKESDVFSNRSRARCTLHYSKRSRLHPHHS